MLPSKIDFTTEHFYDFRDTFVQQNAVNTINIASGVSNNYFSDDLVYEDIEMLDETNITNSLACESLNDSENVNSDEVAVSINNIGGIEDNITEELISLEIELLNIPDPFTYYLEDPIVDKVFYDVAIGQNDDIEGSISTEKVDIVDYLSPFITDDPDFLEIPNGENIAPEDSHVPKSSRKYDPVARKLRYQSTRIKFLTQKIKILENINNSNLLNHLSSKLPPEQFQLVRLLLRNAGKACQGRRFSFEDKTMALAIYKQGPKCYRHLRSMFGFPSKQTLNKHSAKIRFQEGVSPKLMQLIKDSVAKLKKSDKNVTIVWDEIALTAHLDFQETKDYIDGFQDIGATGTNNNFATHALVFMIRGLTSAYKQPIAYFLTENISSSELSELIKLIIKAVFHTGMFISINIRITLDT